MIRLQKETVGLAPGGEHYHKEPTGVPDTPVLIRPTLKDAGIDKNLAKRARTAARNLLVKDAVTSRFGGSFIMAEI
jgi:hypothetical protein